MAINYSNFSYEELIERFGTLKESAERTLKTRVIEDPRLSRPDFEIVWLREDVNRLDETLKQLIHTLQISGSSPWIKNT